MASEIRVDKINSLSGVGTVTLSPTGVDISGITTVQTLKVGTGLTASEDGDVFFTGVCTATTFTGSGANLTSLPAAQLTGTVADARFPATLPAVSAANLTSIPAANVTGTLPALTAANLTNIPAANIVGVCTSGLTKTGGFGIGGKVLQVVQTTKTDTQSIQSQTFTDVSGMSVSITPSATSSKIFVQFSVSLGCNNYGMVNLLRGSTDIFKGDADGSRVSCTIGSATMAVYECKSYSSSFLDSPNTTSATTYKLQAATPYDASYYIHINRAHTDTNGSYLGRMTSQITAMEISA